MLIYNVLEIKNKEYKITPFIVFDEQLEEVVKEECLVFFNDCLKERGSRFPVTEENAFNGYFHRDFESGSHYMLKIIKSYFD